MRSSLPRGQPSLAALICTSLRNLNCHFKSLRLHWLPDNMDTTHWLPNNMDITALARATHRRTHAHTHTWGKYNQIPLRCTHACTPQQFKMTAQMIPTRRPFADLLLRLTLTAARTSTGRHTLSHACFNGPHTHVSTPQASCSSS